MCKVTNINLRNGISTSRDLGRYSFLHKFPELASENLALELGHKHLFSLSSSHLASTELLRSKRHFDQVVEIKMLL